MIQKRLKMKDIEFIYPSHIIAREFDAEVASAGFSHGMKSVDVIFDLPDRLYFVELKDPDSPKAKEYLDRQKWIDSFKSGGEDSSFWKKFLDTFIYEWASGTLNKPVFYFMIIAISGMDSAHFATRKDALSKMIPFNHPIFSPKLKCPPVNLCRCLVLNIEMFNATISDIQVNRLSASS